MKPAKGYYSIIQYCPDLSRLEAANIGVLLFCAERLFLEARTARNNKRIRDFFGKEGHDWVRITSFKRGIEERLRTEAATPRTRACRSKIGYAIHGVMFVCSALEAA